MTTTTQTRQPDSDLLNAFLGRMIGDLGATVSAGLVLIGDRLGIYRAMADGTPVTADALADHTGLAVTYLRPWLANQAAGGYVTHLPGEGPGEGTDRYALSPEQAAALADPDSPAYFAPSVQVALGALHDVEAIADRFRTGQGFGWHEHDANLFVGTERFFRPGYVANLTDAWLPALEGVVPRLEAGARVADVGCGHGASTVLMAAAYPRSTFVGVDYHDASIVVARQRAEEAGVSANTTFATLDAQDLSGDGYDLVTMFDCLHDMGDPVGAARRIRASLAPGGVFMLVEPRAGDHVEDNLNPLGRVFYGASTLICTPSSLAQPGQAAIGTQAGPARITAVLREAGFRSVRIAADTPVNHVYEARD